MFKHTKHFTQFHTFFKNKSQTLYNLTQLFKQNSTKGLQPYTQLYTILNIFTQFCITFYKANTKLYTMHTPLHNATQLCTMFYNILHMFYKQQHCKTLQHFTNLHKTFQPLYKLYKTMFNFTTFFENVKRLYQIYTYFYKVLDLCNTIHKFHTSVHNFAKPYTSLHSFTQTIQKCTKHHQNNHKLNNTFTQLHKTSKTITTLYTTLQHFS